MFGDYPKFAWFDFLPHAWFQRKLCSCQRHPRGCSWCAHVMRAHHDGVCDPESDSKWANCHCARGAEGIFSEIFAVKNLEHNSGSQFIVRSGLLSQHSLAWHNLILPLGIWVQVHQNGHFLRRRPLNPPSPQRLWPVQAGQSLTHPPASEGPQSMVNFSGFSRWNFGASQQVFWDTPKNPCKNPCKHLYKQFLQTIRTEIRAKNQAKTVQKICAENPFKKSVQKIRAKSPCKKSVLKIRADNPYRKSVRNKPVQMASPKQRCKLRNPKCYSNICSCCSSASWLWQKLRMASGELSGTPEGLLTPGLYQPNIRKILPDGLVTCVFGSFQIWQRPCQNEVNLVKDGTFPQTS